MHPCHKTRVTSPLATPVPQDPLLHCYSGCRLTLVPHDSLLQRSQVPLLHPCHTTPCYTVTVVVFYTRATSPLATLLQWLSLIMQTSSGYSRTCSSRHCSSTLLRPCSELPCHTHALCTRAMLVCRTCVQLPLFNFSKNVLVAMGLRPLLHCQVSGIVCSNLFVVANRPRSCCVNLNPDTHSHSHSLERGAGYGIIQQRRSFRP